MNFDSLPDLPPSSTSGAAKSTEFPMDFDLSAISLDLEPSAATPLNGSKVEPQNDLSGIDFAADDNDGGDPLARKLELAEEFRQIGDTDGARDLLNEVVAKSSGAVKSRAQSMLANLG